ncbi:MAG: hypothetical protein WC525_08270 [Candidatus Thermoplasmatota archaeon]
MININAPVTLTGTTNTLTAPRFYDTADPTYYVDPAGSTSLVVNGTIGTMGSVGIGTTNPGVKLDIVGSHISGIGLARFKGNAGAGYMTLDTTTSNTNDSGGFLINIGGTLVGQFGSTKGTAGNNRVFIKNRTAHDAEDLVITESGNVGIGTIAPAQELEVVGDILLTGRLGNDTSYFDIAGNSASYGLLVRKHDYYTSPASTPYLDIFVKDSSVDYTNFLINQRGDTGAAGLVLNASNFVGIGTTTPTSKLHVIAPNSGITVFSGNASNYSFIELGRTVQEGVLGVVHSAEAYSSISAVGDFVIRGTTGSLILATPNAAGAIKFTTGASETEKMRISNEGYVGIGTNAPTKALVVYSASAVAAVFNRSDDGSVVAIQSAGVTEGAISVSGTTVTYGQFTGSHSGWTEAPIQRNYLVRLTGNNRYTHDDPKSEIMYGIEPTAVANDSQVLGSYLSLTEPSEPFGPENAHMIAAVGNGDVYVVDTGVDVKPGDYLISSDALGHAMVDPGTYPLSHVFARAGEGVDWDTVSDTILVDGVWRKHKVISILFDVFAMTNQCINNR